MKHDFVQAGKDNIHNRTLYNDLIKIHFPSKVTINF